MQERLRRSLGSSYIQTLQQQHVSIAAKVGDKGDQGVGFVHGFIPMADIRGQFAALGFAIEDGRTLHVIAAANLEVGSLLRGGCPGIAACRAQDDRVRTFEVVESQVAREAEKNSSAIVFRPLRHGRDILKVCKACESLCTHSLCAVSIYLRKGHYLVPVPNVVL